MMYAVFYISFGLAIAVSGCALATLIHMSHPDSQLYEIFAIAQVVMLGMLGMGIFDEGKSELKKKFSRVKLKTRMPKRSR